MWVIKLGGSLCSDPRLPEWLALIGQFGRGRVTLVCGGGTLADEVRRLQGQWSLDDLPAHNMAVLSMVQTAYLLNDLQPELQLTHRESEILPTLRRGGVALWMPLELLRDRPDTNTNWDVTGDSIALGLAQRLNAERLIVVKSCEVNPLLTLEQLVETDVLDRRFATLAHQAWLPIDLLHGDQLDELREMLLGTDGRQSMGMERRLA